MTKASKKDLLDLMKIEESRFDANSFALSRQNFLYHINRESVYVMRSDEKTVGYILLLNRKNSRYIRIYSLAVNIDGFGFGKKLLKFAINYAKDRDKNLTLEVRSDNQKAVDLYTKNGFIITKTVKSYYPDKTDALKMVKICD